MVTQEFGDQGGDPGHLMAMGHHGHVDDAVAESSKC
jgi:hypothetical protein